jgi:hypothetical protein
MQNTMSFLLIDIISMKIVFPSSKMVKKYKIYTFSRLKLNMADAAGDLNRLDPKLEELSKGPSGDINAAMAESPEPDVALDVVGDINNDDDEEDYTGMPDLCDNEKSKAGEEKKAGEDKMAAKVSNSGAAVASSLEEKSGRLGEWDDILGSGR